MAAAVTVDPLQDDAALLDVCFVDQKLGWAVGRHGVILRTSDGGDTWRPQQSGVETSLHGVDFIDARTGWIVGGAMRAYGGGSRGVVLHTSDGGETWKQAPSLLPALRRVTFFDATRGIALGCGSESLPAGVFGTVDGGQSWQPRGGGAQQVCLAGSFVDPANGFVAGAAGRSAQLVEGALGESQLVDSAGRTLRDAVLAGPTDGWLVGDGGLVYRTSDLGHTWQTLSSLPASEVGAADLRAVAVIKRLTWIAGAPGAYVLHSADGGATWRRQFTGVRTPINRIQFIDAQHGWAVGDLGVVVATVDGGKSWRVQRGGERRAAVLAIESTARDLPVEALAQLALDEGYRTAAYVVADPEFDGRNGNVELLARIEDAAASLGLGGAAAAWRFPSPSSRLHLDADRLRTAINRMNDGRAEQLMIADIVRQIRTWQPDVLILPSGDAEGQRPLAAVVGQAALEAAVQAADSTQQIELASQWNLAPWQISRVFASLPPGARGTHHVTVSAAARRLQKPLIDLADEPRTLLHAPRLRSDATIEFQLLYGDGAERSDDLMAGLSIPAGGAARRSWLPMEQKVDALRVRKLAELRRNLRQIISRSAESSAWIGQLVELLADFEPDAATAVTMELADELRRQGQIDLVADLMHVLVTRYPEHERSDQALGWLVRFYASAETAHAYSTSGHAMRQADVASESAEVQLALGGADGDGGVVPASAGFSASLSSDERLTRAVQLSDYISRTRPLLSAQHSLRFPWSVAQRKRGFDGSAQRYLLTVERRPPGDPWQACAAVEAWLREPDEHPPVKPIATCRTIVQRPHLDGRLDEPLWQSTGPVRLKDADAQSPLGGVEVRLAYDYQFLFIGARCAKAPQVQYQRDQRPRTYDGDVENHDRLRILLDLDRDYSTWFELVVDCRGWTADRCWGDPSWNPTWYVAADQDKENWTIEAAVPWTQLTSTPPKTRHVWAAAVERVAPPVGLQSWTGGSLEQPTPDDFGIVIFE